jgi:hypothetical protein
MAGMAWPDQNPLANDVILHVNVPCAGGSPAYLEIDKLPDGTYRATVGTLFEHQDDLPDAEPGSASATSQRDGGVPVL